MGADLYLPTVLQACARQYERTAQLVNEARQLAQGDCELALFQEGQRLKEALARHAEQVSEMSLALFDLVAEIADLAQGEYTVWTMALAGQVAEQVHQIDRESEHPVEGGPTGLVSLADDLVDLLKGRSEAVIAHGVTALAQQLAQAANERLVSSPLEEKVPVQALSAFGSSMVELLQGQPQRALVLLAEHFLLPQLEQACAAQANCLTALDQALAPLLAQADTAGADFTASQALFRWSELTRRLSDTMRVWLRSFREMLQAPAYSRETLAQHFADIGDDLEALAEEQGALLPELKAVMDTLSDLLLRTLPSPSFVLTRPLGSEIEQASPRSARPSPLQQAFGTMHRHQALCDQVVRLLARCEQILERVLAEEPLPALLEICQGMVGMLYATHEEAQSDESEQSLAQRITSGVPRTVELAPGVTMLPGSLMDLCYTQFQVATHQLEHRHHLQAWIAHALADEHSLTGMIMRMHRLLQGKPDLWAQLLASLLRDALADSRAPAAEREQALALVEQLFALLSGWPAQRLDVQLCALHAQISAESPLVGPVETLQRLAQGQTGEQLDQTLTSLVSEVERHVTDWPEERSRALRFLLDLTRAWLHTPEEQHPHLCLATLARLCEEEHDEAEEDFFTRLAQVLASPAEDAARLAAIQSLLSELPEPGPQAPCADPCQFPCWHLRLLRDLLAKVSQQGTQSQGSGEDESASGGQGAAFPAAAHILGFMQRTVRSWLRPANGYFRDPYTDASILWVAAGAFWPAIADVIAEPIDETPLDLPAWLAEEAIPARLPLPRIHELIALLNEHEGSMHLPSQEQLARWGQQTIRVEESGPYGISGWYAYFEERRRAFVAFLEGALAREEPILCSL